MKAFFEEYGLVIVAVIVLSALIAIATLISSQGKTSLQNTFHQFETMAGKALETPTEAPTEAPTE